MTTHKTPDLTPEARKNLLEGRRYAVLATINRDSSVHLTPVWYLFKDDFLFVTSNVATRKVRNIVANPQVSLIVDVRKPVAHKWVCASGTAEIIRDEESRRINTEVFKRYVTPAGLQEPKVAPFLQPLHDVTIRIAPKTWRSLDGQPVFQQMFPGIPTGTVEQWFLPLDV